MTGANPEVFGELVVWKCADTISAKTVPAKNKVHPVKVNKA
jgi:hypothetical protein